MAASGPAAGARLRVAEPEPAALVHSSADFAQSFRLVRRRDHSLMRNAMGHQAPALALLPPPAPVFLQTWAVCWRYDGSWQGE